MQESTGCGLTKAETRIRPNPFIDGKNSGELAIPSPETESPYCSGDPKNSAKSPVKGELSLIEDPYSVVIHGLIFEDLHHSARLFCQGGGARSARRISGTLKRRKLNGSRGVAQSLGNVDWYGLMAGPVHGRNRDVSRCICERLDKMVSKETRRLYAEEVGTMANIGSAALLEALAVVPREDFVGQGPWKILSKPAPGQKQPQMTEVSEPSELYRDVAVFLDAKKMLTNGNPSTLAPWLDALNLAAGKSVFHLGCGTGYYTAVIAEVVGPHGRVTAVEVDPALARQARESLSRYPNVEVIEGDGGMIDTGARDAILVNAGVTHPADTWLDSLTDAGTLVLPMTVEFGMPNIGKGLAACVSKSGSTYSARFLPTPVMIYSCTSVRDSEVASLFGQMMMSGTFSSVRSLRRDVHTSEPTCCLHAAKFCLSTFPIGR